MEQIEGCEQPVGQVLNRIRQRLRLLGASSESRQAIGDDDQLYIDSLRDALGIVAQLLPSTSQDSEGLLQLVESLAVVDSVDRSGVGEMDMDSLLPARADRFLELEREQLQCIFSATTNLVLVTDGCGMVTHLNPAAEHFFSESVWCGVPFWQLLALPGNGLDEVMASYAPDSHHEIFLPWAGQWFNLRLVPFVPRSDASAGYVLILNDITWLVDSRQHLEKLVAERTRALTNSEKMLRLIFQSVGNGILLLSDDYRIVKANQRAGQIHGCSADALLGKDLRDLTDHHGRWTLTSCIEALSNETSMSAEIQVQRSDGSMLPTSFMVTSVAIDGRHFWSIIVRDISRQKALEERLRMEKQQVEEMNVTLRNVMKSVDGERKEFEHTLARRIRSHLLPAIDRIEGESSENIRASYLDLVREQLIGLTSGSASEIDANLLKLSKTEMRICQFIQAGCSTKDICEAMNLAFETVQTHRKNIRRKLGLRGKNVNLHSYLIGRRSLSAD